MTMTQPAEVSPRGIGLLHAAATGAAVVLFLLILFWASEASGALPHLRALFGPLGAGSPTALLIVALYAVIVGAFVGLVLAVFYNLFRFLAPRPTRT